MPEEVKAREDVVSEASHAMHATASLGGEARDTNISTVNRMEVRARPDSIEEEPV